MAYWSKKVVLETLVKEGVISLGRGRVISSIDLANNPGNYPVYSSSAQRNGLFGAFSLFDFDEELITWSVDGGGHFFHRPKHRFSVTNVAGTLRIVDDKKYDYKFLYYLLVFQHSSQLFNYVDKAHPSVIRKRYSVPEIEVVEQRQIARILSKVDEAISQTEQLIAKYRHLKAGLMQDLLTKGIDEHGNIRSEETHAFKDSPLGRIPAEWEVVQLGELISALDPQPDHRTPPAQVHGIPYLGIGDVLPNGEIDLDNCRKVSIAAFEKQQKSFRIQKGDLIFGKRGTIGRPTVLPDFEKCNFALSSNVILIKPNQCPEFIFWALISKRIDDQIKLFINTTSQPSFGMKEIRELEIYSPKPAERNRISSRLNKVENVLIEEGTNLAKLQSLKTGLMQDLLSGKVRVRQLIRETADV